MIKSFFGRGLLYLSRRIQWAAIRLDPPPPPPPPPPPIEPPVKSEKELAHERWVCDKGDQSLRLDYDLDSHSMVIDLGGYEGQWASDIYSKYCCTIHVFEPVPQYFNLVLQRFLNNKNISVHGFAAGAEDGFIGLSVAGDASSVHVQSGDNIQVPIVNLIDWLATQCIDDISLIKINIEGGEYELLEHLIDTGFIERVRDLQVQFHDFVDNADERMSSIQSKLAKTHHLTYMYKFVWENWRRNVNS